MNAFSPIGGVGRILEPPDREALSPPNAAESTELLSLDFLRNPLGQHPVE